MHSIQIAAGNGRHYGDGMTVSDLAEIDDGLLHLYSLKPQGLGKIILGFPAQYLGKHRSREGSRYVSAHEINVETSRPLAINTDGELTTQTPAQFFIEHGAITVIVPSDSTGAAGGND